MPSLLSCSHTPSLNPSPSLKPTRCVSWGQQDKHHSADRQSSAFTKTKTARKTFYPGEDRFGRGKNWWGDFALTLWSDLSIIKAAAAAAESRRLSWWKLPTCYSCSFADKLLASSRILNCTRLHTQVTHKPRQLKQVKATQTQQFSTHAQNAPWEMQPASAGPGKFSFHTLSASLKVSFPDSFIPPNEASPVSRSPLFK